MYLIYSVLAVFSGLITIWIGFFNPSPNPISLALFIAGSLLIASAVITLVIQISRLRKRESIVNALFLTKFYSEILRLYDKYGYGTFYHYSLLQPFYDFLEERWQNQILENTHFSNIFESKIIEELAFINKHVGENISKDIKNRLELAFYRFTLKIGDTGFAYWMKRCFDPSAAHLREMILSLPWARNSDEDENDLEFQKRVIAQIEKYSDEYLKTESHLNSIQMRAIKNQLVQGILDADKRSRINIPLKVV